MGRSRQPLRQQLRPPSGPRRNHQLPRRLSGALAALQAQPAFPDVGTARRQRCRHAGARPMADAANLDLWRRRLRGDLRAPGNRFPRGQRRALADRPLPHAAPGLRAMAHRHRNGAGMSALLCQLELGGAGPTIVIKDSIDIAGLPTQAGSAALADAKPATQHAEVVRALLAADWRISGKATMHELAY